MVPANVDSVLVIAFRLILLLCCLYALCYLCAVIMQFLLEKYRVTGIWFRNLIGNSCCVTTSN